jgi:uncharacterized protein
MKSIALLIIGMLFGAGVTISGMVNPMRVQNFMDITGTFDPTLLFVMAAGLITTFVGYRWVLKRERPLLDSSFSLPVRTVVDAPLVAGAVLFGMGWGLTGFCPGPAIASIVFGYPESIIFIASMGAGTILIKLLSNGRGKPAVAEASLGEG